MKKDVLVCPRCQSTKNTPFWGNAFAVDTGIFRDFRKCSDCGYVGRLFMKPDDALPYEIERPKKKKPFFMPEKFTPIHYVLLALLILFIIFLIFL